MLPFSLQLHSESIRLNVLTERAAAQEIVRNLRIVSRGGATLPCERESIPRSLLIGKLLFLAFPYLAKLHVELVLQQ